VKSWEGTTDFLTQLARNSGKLLRGGEPDLNTAARVVLYDWQRGKIPYFSLPPDYEDRGSALDKARRPSQAVTVSPSHKLAITNPSPAVTVPVDLLWANACCAASGSIR